MTFHIVSQERVAENNYSPAKEVKSILISQRKENMSKSKYGQERRESNKGGVNLGIERPKLYEVVRDLPRFISTETSDVVKVQLCTISILQPPA